MQYYLEKFYLKALKYNSINKFQYKKTKKILKIEKIILKFNCKKDLKFKNLTKYLLALELISNQKSFITQTKHSNLLLKIKKGGPAGSKVTLRKKQLFLFFFKTLTEIFSTLENFELKKIKRINNSLNFSYTIKTPFKFRDLQKHYHLFNNILKLNMTINQKIKKKNELIFFLNSFKFCKYNSIGRV